MASVEDQIRDNLAECLHVIDPGLELIDKNYHLTNSRGTRGFVDILARDAHGIFTVIELKRSDKTAREALHEVLKYKELLQFELGIAPSEISAMVVSTHWSELRAPFSRLRREWDSSLRGFKLELVPDTTVPIAAAEVLPEPEADEHGLTPVHCFILTARPFDRAWSEFAQDLAAVGADDALGIVLDDGQQQMLYVVVGKIADGDPRTSELDYLLEDLPDNGIEVPSGFGNEYRALSYALENLVVDDNHFEYSYPERLGALLETGGWTVASTFRSGIFAKQAALYTDSVLAERVVDADGQSDVVSTGSAPLGHKKAWSRARRNLDKALTANPRWQNVVKRWLDELETESDVEIKFDTHNLCDLVATLVYGWSEELSSYVPKLSIAARVGSTPPGRMLVGVLTWTGSNDLKFDEVVRSVYPRPTEWSMERTFGAVWDTDAELLAKLGLRYECFEFNTSGRTQRLVLQEETGELTREDPDQISPEGDELWLEARPLSDFLNYYVEEVNNFVESYRAQTFINLKGGWQVVTGFEDVPLVEEEE